MKIITEEAAPVTTLRKSVPPNVAAAVAQGAGEAAGRPVRDRRGVRDALIDPGYGPRTSSMTGLGAMRPARRGPDSPWPDGRSGSSRPSPGVAAGPGAGPGPGPVRRYALEMTGAEASCDIRRCRSSPSVPMATGSAYVGGGAAGSRQIWIRDRDQLHARPLAGTDGAAGLSWSADGRQRGLRGQSRRAQGGRGGRRTRRPSWPIRSSATGGTAWGPDGVIYAAGGFRSSGVGPGECPRDRGRPDRASPRLDTARHEFAHLSPTVLPNNRGLVFSVWYGPTRTQRHRDRRPRLQDRSVPDPPARAAGAVPRHGAPADRAGRRVAGGGPVRPGQAGARPARQCRW